jgi:hypothetical protein
MYVLNEHTTSWFNFLFCYTPIDSNYYLVPRKQHGKSETKFTLSQYYQSGVGNGMVIGCMG